MSEKNKKKLDYGIFIAIEGIDGAGKSSQAKMLCAALENEGYDTEYLKEPTDGDYGRKIRALAEKGRDGISAREEFLLFLNDRREDVEKNIRPALEEGKIVVIDRYFYSSIAYQGAKGLDPEFVNSENRKIAITPDLTIYLYIPVDKAPHRIEKSRGDNLNLFENLESLKKVKKIFDEMDYPEMVRVDGTGEVEEVHKRILKLVKNTIQDKQ